MPERVDYILKTTAGYCFALLMALQACDTSPSPPLTPAESLESFELADKSLEITLVASEPLVQDPVAISFDESGRLWVVEMLGFMRDIEGTGEKDRIGRVSVLFDDNGDGEMDRRETFVDTLILPRALAIVKGGALIAEDFPLWFAEDPDGDLDPESLSLVDATYGGLGMPEHSANGLWRGLDNWYYNAKSGHRYKREKGNWIRGDTEFRGQWGICHDNAGRLFYNYNWSQLHADLVPPNALMNNTHHSPSSGIDHGLTLNREIFPIRSNTAVNRGYIPGTLDRQGKLLEFASACGPLVFRGTALPSRYLGDAFICEPTANLIKQNNISQEGFMLSAEAVYPDREFLASTDERFRPISLASGPDGALYVVDMYKGIIQHGPYMTPYLREETLERKLDMPVHMGRIWRIGSRGKPQDQPPVLSGMEPVQLVAQLGSPNGWTRDMAQRLLVEQADVDVISELEQMVRTGVPLGKLHALWTLEGRHYAEPAIFFEAMGMEDPVVAQSALRILADRLSGQSGLASDIEVFIRDHYEKAPPLLQMQMVLESDIMSRPAAFAIAHAFLSSYGHLPVGRDVVMSSLEDREWAFMQAVLTEASVYPYDQNREIFIELLSTAIANKGMKAELEGVFELLAQRDIKTPLWVRSAMVNGLLNHSGAAEGKPIALGAMPGVFNRLGAAEEALRPQLENLRGLVTWPGKPEGTEVISSMEYDIPHDILALGRQQYINTCASCHGTQGEGISRFAPPLKHSEWVNGEDYKLVMLLLHGMEGPVMVNGKHYDIPDILPEMPSFSTMQDKDIAAIATYIRNAWGNSAPPVSPGAVGGIRFRTQGKITPWTASELDTVRFDKSL